MKKRITITFVLLMVLMLGTVTVHAQEDWRLFEEDFESYDLGAPEEQEAFTDTWTNHSWSGSGDADPNVDGVLDIREENSNQYLNFEHNDSFFYMGPHDIRSKDFEISFDFRANDLTDAWIGWNVRKEFRDARFNGTTGMLIYLRTVHTHDTDENITGEQVVVNFLRGGLMSETDLNDEATGDRAYVYEYPTEGPVEEDRIKGNWLNARIVVSDTENEGEAEYKVYINDQLQGTLVHSRNALDIYGFMSLNASTGNYDIDNIRIELNDEEPAPPLVRISTSVPQTADVGEEIELPSFDEGDIELIGAAEEDFYIEIETPDENTIQLDPGVFTYTPASTGIYTIRFMAENDTGQIGESSHLINVSESDDPGDETTTTEDVTDPNDDNEPNEDANNTGLIIGIVAGVIVVGVAGVFFLKRG